MPEEVTELDAYKSSITKRFFIDTADDNYIVARWCYFHALNVDFSWLAVHCLEKYLKAALLLNGHSSIGFTDSAGKQRRFGHDIMLLYERVCTFASGLLPTMLIKPNGVYSAMWSPESVEAYLARLYRDGNADNRYQLLGFAHHPGEVFKLDAMVFAVRRICVKLDGYVFNRSAREEAKRCDLEANLDFSEREMLMRNLDHWNSIIGKLPDAVNGRRDEEVKRAALHQNFAFCKPGEEPDEIQFRSAASNSVLWQDIVHPATSGDAQQKERARQLGRWTIDNIKLPRETVAELERAIKQRSTTGIDGVVHDSIRA
jgi:hypothetical protein